MRDEARSAFLALLLGWGITLVSSEEVAEGTPGAATPDDARHFLESNQAELEAAAAAASVRGTVPGAGGQPLAGPSSVAAAAAAAADFDEMD